MGTAVDCEFVARAPAPSGMSCWSAQPPTTNHAKRMSLGALLLRWTVNLPRTGTPLTRMTSLAVVCSVASTKLDVVVSGTLTDLLVAPVLALLR
jgi:hypothetical protein